MSSVLSFVSHARIEFVIGQIHRANPHFGDLKIIDFNTKEVISRQRIYGPQESHKYQIENDVLIYRGLRFVL